MAIRIFVVRYPGYHMGVNILKGRCILLTYPFGDILHVPRHDLIITLRMFFIPDLRIGIDDPGFYLNIFVMPDRVTGFHDGGVGSEIKTGKKMGIRDRFFVIEQCPGFGLHCRENKADIFSVIIENIQIIIALSEICHP